MHMQDGVGRQGYKVLAWVFLAIGVVGLGAGWYAFANQLFPFQWLGFGLAAAGLGALVLVNLTVLSQTGDAPTAAPAPSAPSPPAAVAQRAPVRPAETPVQRLPPPRTMVRLGPAIPPKPKQAPAAPSAMPPAGAAASAAPVPAQPEARPDGAPVVEYPDAQPAAKAAPTEMVLPPAFERTAPGEHPWPERRAPSGVTLGEMQNRAAQQLSVTPPVVMAKIWYPQSAMPRGWGKGQCGDCGTALVAPPQRPLRLRCPHCDKVTDLS